MNENEKPVIYINWDEMNGEPETGFEQDREDLGNFAQEIYDNFYGDDDE